MGAFTVGVLYDSTPGTVECESIGDAVQHAAAFAMHSGQTYTVRFMDTVLVSISPSSIDWRRVNAEHILKVKAMAHDLVTAVDVLCPMSKKDGLT